MLSLAGRRPLLDAVADNPEELVAFLSCPVMAERLRCVECGVEAEAGARGWRTYLTIDDEVATYCPGCAREEFGHAS